MVIALAEAIEEATDH